MSYIRTLHVMLTLRSDDPLTPDRLAAFAGNVVAEIGHLGDVHVQPLVAPPWYDALCDVIDRAKNDDRSLDTDEYAGMILDVMRPQISAPPEEVAAAVLDSHSIRHDWRRTGEQIIPLIVEGIQAAYGAPGASLTATSNHQEEPA